MDFSLFSDEAIISAIIGALIGSALSYLLTVFSDRRKQRREMRLSIGVELTTIGHNYLATLHELQSARNSKDQSAARSYIAQLLRLDGDLSAIQTRLWYFFSERRVRAALSRFRHRCNTITDYLYTKTRNEMEADIAIDWLAEGIEELCRQTFEAAGLPYRDPGGYVFMGFKKISYEDKRLLSFDDGPPPWDFAVTFDFTKKVDENGLEKARNNLHKKAGHLRCKNHHRATHIILHGVDTRKFDILIDVCCREFGDKVGKAIDLDIAKASFHEASA